jgi:hypothetical protein
VRANKKERYATGQEVLRDINLISNAEKNREIPTVINTPINTDTANRRRNIDLVKKLVLPSLAMLAAIPLFLWIKISLLTSSSTTLSLNGKVISQELNADNLCQDSILEAGIYCQKYTFDGEQKREIVIDMNSNNFDSFLILQNPNGDKLEINGDRSINNSNAQIKVQLPSSGKYTVIARTTYPGESGEYTIRARYNN